jgi:IMP dehydrogenase
MPTPLTHPTPMAPGSLSYLDPSKVFDVLKNYPSSDGLSIDQLMNSTLHGGLTYNDFLMLPGKIDFSAHQVVTESRITRNVVLKTPFISSPMDTVTGDEMAVSMAVRHPGEFDRGTAHVHLRHV